MVLPGSAASPDLPVPAGSAPPAVAPVCVVKRFRKNPSGQSASVKGGGCANAQGDAPVEGEASEAVGFEPGEPSYQADGFPTGRASAQGDALVKGESTIQAPKAVGSEPGEPSYQADGVPKEMGNAQSSQRSDPMSKQAPPVYRRLVQRYVGVKPKIWLPESFTRQSVVRLGKSGFTWVRVMPLIPQTDLLDCQSGVGDAAPDREGAFKTSSREVTTTARTKSSHRIESEQAVRLAPPERVSRPGVHPQSDVSPASSVSDAETVGAQYPEVQLGFNVNQVASGGPGHGPSGPCATGREAGTYNKASSASEATTEPTGNPLGSSAKYAQRVMGPQLEGCPDLLSSMSQVHQPRLLLRQKVRGNVRPPVR
ncbi:unnamed protein product [Symbiodinium natans]|uniref:Uncharacterized protein n=1 Tax=Symbiodinium natans TaxID=878477 RepID=A0A812MSI2_9DINO|nr:unnamed protein product [Symbiodinium natans]